MQASRLSQPWCKCSVSVSDRFDGMLVQFLVFFRQCQFINLWPEDIQTDQDKVRCIINLLVGLVSKWVTLLLMQPSLLLDNFAVFCVQLKSMFEEPLKAQILIDNCRSWNKAMPGGWYQLLLPIKPGLKMEWGGPHRSEALLGITRWVARTDCPNTL